MARHVVTVEVSEVPKAKRAAYLRTKKTLFASGLRFQATAQVGTYKFPFAYGGSTPLVAATRAVRAALAAYYRD